MSEKIVIPPGQALPSQAAWDAMVSASNRIQILAGGMLAFRDSEKRIVGYPLGTRVIFESLQPEDLSSLQACVRFRDDARGAVCLDGGGQLAFRFFQGEQQIALLGFHTDWGADPVWFTWDRWFGIAPLLDSQGILDWLKTHRVSFPTPQEEAEMQKQRNQAYIERVLPIWLGAIPTPLVSLISLEQHRDLLAHPLNSAALAPLQQALEELYPDQRERARFLFRWYGSNDGTWNSFPIQEMVPSQLLQQLPVDILVQAIDGIELSSAELEGAGRYFSGGEVRRSIGYTVPVWKYLPERLCQRLLDHALPTPNRDRALKAFAPPPDML